MKAKLSFLAAGVLAAVFSMSIVADEAGAGSTGACCHIEGCTDVPGETICLESYTNGVFQGALTNCNTAICPVTTKGACCYGGGCVEFDAETCRIEFGGFYAGDDTTCDIPGICATGSTMTVDSTTTTSTTSSTTTSSTTTTTAIVCGDGSVGGSEECDDGNTGDGDGCDSNCLVEECWTCASGCARGDAPCGPSECTPDASDTPCDDGDICTTGEVCTAGSCGDGAVSILLSMCHWVAVGGTCDTDAQAKGNGASVITGDVCGDRLKIGEDSMHTGSIAATEDKPGAKGIKFVKGGELLTGDGVTAGSRIIATGKDGQVPHTTPVVSDIVSGSTIAKDNGGTYDTTGAHPLVADCVQAQEDADVAEVSVRALAGSVTSLGNVSVDKGGSVTYTAAANGLNIYDADSFLMKPDATVVLDGNGFANPIFVFRVNDGNDGSNKDKFTMKLRSAIVLQNGATPSGVLWYVAGKKCQVGDKATLFGTLFCPNGKVKLQNQSETTGAAHAGKGKVQVGKQGVLTIDSFFHAL